CDMRQAKAFCAGAQALGCAVALDDFGAGFGGLHYLKHLPFSYLKIDGDFIRGLPCSAHDQRVVRALVGLARGIGFSTIAEFVRDRATMRMLRELGVDYAQDRKSTRLNSSHVAISYAVFCLKKKKNCGRLTEVRGPRR